MVVGYKESENLNTNQKLIAGVVSGVTTRFISQPLDIIKVRTQLQAKTKAETKTWVRLTWHMLREEGISAFWHGHCLGQVHSVLSVSSQFYVYELTTKLVVNHFPDPQYRSFFLFLCGIFAGCASATIVSPIEVIRIRQMMVKAQYGGMWHSAQIIYRRGGLLAFYDGLTASLAQMGPQVAITFSVFRVVQRPILLYLRPPENGQVYENLDESKVTKTDVLVASSIAGSIAGFVAKTLTYPFDLAKKRLQISRHKLDPTVNAPSLSRHVVKCTTLMQCMRDMFRKDGYRGLFKGLGITIYKAQVNSVVALTTYEMMCLVLRENRPDI